MAEPSLPVFRLDVARAQSYPSRPSVMVVLYAAGSVTAAAIERSSPEYLAGFVADELVR
jgi:hypothetical protein